MNPGALFIVDSDPRKSPRPAEAVRIAAGIGAWKKVDVTLYLRGPAVLALSEYPDELIDEDNYVRYLPIVGEFGRPVYVEKRAALLGELGESPIPWEELSDEALAGLAATQRYVLRF
jgi:hypothetical protein